jgi:hypothetical protein
MGTIGRHLSTSGHFPIKLPLLHMLPLEKALFGIGTGDRNSSIVARHYGFDGKGGANFQRTGDEFGLTRERVRQIVSESDPCKRLLPGTCPALDRVIAFIAASLPAQAAEIERQLQAAGLTMKPFRIEGIINIADLLHRPVPFRMGALNKKRYVLPVSCASFDDIVGRARQEVRQHGMATIADFVNEALPREGGPREANLIEAILTGQPDFRWLDRRSGWFWLVDTPRNCAVKRVRKMLAVANPLTVEELRAGLGRMGSPPAPESTLLAFCSQIEGLSVTGNMIHASPRIDADEVLNQTERDIYQLLSENKGCMVNSDLIWESSRLGMKRPTFYQCVTYSPIVARYNGRHYRLIGSPGLPAQVKESDAAVLEASLAGDYT